MDLQSGKLYWPTTVSNPPEYPPLTESIQCDVLVIGGGISGSLCAYHLAERGLKVVVVDKRKIGEGSTSANTAVIQLAGEKSFVTLANHFGEEIISRHMKLCWQAINEFEDICKKLPIDAHFVRRDSLYYSSYEADIPSLKKEYNLLNKLGFQVELWSKNQIEAVYPFRKQAALYYYNEAELNPLKFVYGLLEKVRTLGGQIYGETQIKGRKVDKDTAVFLTAAPDRHQIKAKHVIIAAGNENHDFISEKNADIISSYAVITKPVSDLSSWYKRSLIWETARPYVYMRTTPDDRVIIGGMDKDTTIAEARDSKILRSRDKLMEAFHKLFPDVTAEPEYFLGGFLSVTHDGLPMIGRYHHYPHCHIVMAYGDNAIVYNGVLSRILADVITEGASPDLAMYLSTRPLFHN
ncbi:FAD-binding oxidoreductase [Neobacillus mesonae]|nr:FAD-binding oxidoreductase [Neobacillus mesonae]